MIFPQTVRIKRKRALLAYSGGLDTTCILFWLQDQGFDVVTYSANLGGGEDFKAIEKKARDCGASHAIMEDLRGQFSQDYVFALLRSNALYEGQYHLGTAIARPLIAHRMVVLAQELGCGYLSHGATGLGNDQIRFEHVWHMWDKNHDIKKMIPWRHPQWTLESREDLVQYARDKGFTVPINAQGRPNYSIDSNLFHISMEGNVLEDPWEETPDVMRPEVSNETPLTLTVTFHDGNPVAIDGKALTPLEILIFLNEKAQVRGIGVVDCVESRIIGTKSRGVYKTPAGTVLLKARKTLEPMVLERDVISLREQLMPRYARLVYDGLWFGQERLLLQHLFDESSRSVSGDVRLCLKPECVEILARKAVDSLYNKKSVTFDNAKPPFNPKEDMNGFIKISALGTKAVQDI